VAGVTTLDHVTLTVPELGGAARFYDAVLGALGLVRMQELVDEEEDDPSAEALGWGPPDGAAVLWLITGPVPTTGLHASFATDGPAEVEAFAAAAVACGGRLRAAPRRWPIYRRGRFSAMVEDAAGNVLEAVAPER